MPCKQTPSSSNHIAKALKVRVKLPTHLRKLPKLLVRQILNIRFRKICQERLNGPENLPKPIARSKRWKSIKLTYAILHDKWGIPT